MKYGILYKPTNEYVVLDDNKLFTDSIEEVENELNNLLFTDGGYDGLEDDFSIDVVNTDSNGSEFVKDNTIFVAKSLIK